MAETIIEKQDSDSQLVTQLADYRKAHPESHPYAFIDNTPVGAAMRFILHCPDKLMLVRESEGDMAVYIERKGGTWEKDIGVVGKYLIDAQKEWLFKVTTSKGGADAKNAVSLVSRLAEPSGKAAALGSVPVAYQILKGEGEIPASLTLALREDVDSDMSVLGAPNGVIDLVTGKLLSPKEGRKRKVTRSTPDDYNPKARHEWVDALTGHLDPQQAEYLWQSLGYALKGNPARRWYVLAGEKGGGKSTLLNAINAALGRAENDGYSSTLAASALLRQSKQSGRNAHQADLARKGGGRFALMAEPQPGQFDTTLIKSLSGGDMRSDRDVREKTPPPTAWRASIIVAMNPPELENLRLNDDALAARTFILNYPRLPLAAGEIDPARVNAVSDCKEVRQAILAKLVKYAVATLSPPAEIQSIKENRRRQEEDSLGDFRLWLRDSIKLTGNPTDRLWIQDVWESAITRFEPDKYDEIDGVSKTQLGRTINRLELGLPNSVSARNFMGKQARYYPGAVLSPIEDSDTDHPIALPDSQMALDGHICAACGQPEIDEDNRIIVDSKGIWEHVAGLNSWN